MTNTCSNCQSVQGPRQQVCTVCGNDLAKQVVTRLKETPLTLGELIKHTQVIADSGLSLDATIGLEFKGGGWWMTASDAITGLFGSISLTQWRVPK